MTPEEYEELSSHVERTRSMLFHMGRESGITERFIHNKKVKAGVRSDLFGLFDIVSMSYADGIIGIQVCGKADVASHIRKITIGRRKFTHMWLSGMGKIELWVWCKVPITPGSDKLIWRPRIGGVYLDKEYQKEVKFCLIKSEKQEDGARSATG